MFSRACAVAVASLLATVSMSCSDRQVGMGPMGPSGMGMGGAGLLSVSPAGNAVGVPVNTPVVLRFSRAMGGGMEQYVALHNGDLSGPVVPMACGWSGDRTTLTCTPTTTLRPRSRYAIHAGGGMMDAYGLGVDMGGGMGMGGVWAYSGMMGPGMMGAGWQGANGSYGMVFSFETAG